MGTVRNGNRESNVRGKKENRRRGGSISSVVVEKVMTHCMYGLGALYVR